MSLGGWTPPLNDCMRPHWQRIKSFDNLKIAKESCKFLSTIGLCNKFINHLLKSLTCSGSLTYDIRYASWNHLELDVSMASCNTMTSFAHFKADRTLALYFFSKIILGPEHRSTPGGFRCDVLSLSRDSLIRIDFARNDWRPFVTAVRTPVVLSRQPAVQIFAGLSLANSPIISLCFVLRFSAVDANSRFVHARDASWRTCSLSNFEPS